MIYDCFMFYNEYDVAEIRINELKDVVDKFVVIEGATTFRQRKNDNHFYCRTDANIDVHRVDIPSNLYTWNAEKYLRRYSKQALLKSGADALDRVIISDCDEIVKADIVGNLISSRDMQFTIDQYYYNFNNYRGKSQAPYSLLMENLTDAEDQRHTNHPYTWDNAGWEFSYFGDEQFIKNKIQNFSHSELDLDQFTDPAKIAERLANNSDPFDRGDGEQTTNNPLPNYVLNNPERFKKYL